jgi:hypothetical protein
MLYAHRDKYRHLSYPLCLQQPPSILHSFPSLHVSSTIQHDNTSLSSLDTNAQRRLWLHDSLVPLQVCFWGYNLMCPTLFFIGNHIATDIWLHIKCVFLTLLIRVIWENEICVPPHWVTTIDMASLTVVNDWFEVTQIYFVNNCFQLKLFMARNWRVFCSMGATWQTLRDNF